MDGRLINKFEGCFGESYPWKGYSPGPGRICSVSEGFVWSRLTKNVLDKISRRVVSLASFNGDFYNYYDHYFYVLVFDHS